MGLKEKRAPERVEGDRDVTEDGMRVVDDWVDGALFSALREVSISGPFLFSSIYVQSCRLKIKGRIPEMAQKPHHLHLRRFRPPKP